jgi:hypothetical protein
MTSDNMCFQFEKRVRQGGVRGSHRDVVYLFWPVAYMSDRLVRKKQNAGGAGSHWLWRAVRNAHGAQIKL